MERCECFFNRLSSALEQLANTLISNREANSFSTTDSGERLSGFQYPQSEFRGGISSLLVFGIVAMLLFSLFLRYRNREVDNTGNEEYVSISKQKKQN